MTNAVRKPWVIAIDGPAGSGKSTVASLLAKRLGFVRLNTGALYRCVALCAQERGAEPATEPAWDEMLSGMQVRFGEGAAEGHVFLRDRDVTERIRDPEISRLASKLSQVPRVRQFLLPLQRRLAAQSTRGVVLEGRDIGTVVFPDADLKFFLVASPQVRASRRYQELKAQGLEIAWEAVWADQLQRDADDQARDLAPLKPAPDAVHMDSSSLPAEAVAESMAGLVEKRMRSTLL